MAANDTRDIVTRSPAIASRIIGAALLMLALVPALLGQSVAARDTRPTIVLVHGAWAGPAGWDQVVRRLRDDDYRTAAPTLGLQTLDADVATVRATLDGIKGKKILVGHSYGGAVISNAAAGRTDVLGLVYTAAFVPDQGRSILDLGAGYQPPAALPHLMFSGTPFASPCTINPAYFPQDFAQDLPAKQAAILNAQQRPFNFPIFSTPSGPVAWHTLPSWYAVSGADRMIDPALQQAEAMRIGATTITFADASHAGGFTVHAERFTGLIERAAEATTEAR
jgi:pimeloyl-ACP methyl ester carboxylesterase